MCYRDLFLQKECHLQSNFNMVSRVCKHDNSLGKKIVSVREEPLV